MAWSKEIEVNNSGVSATYWKLEKVTFNFDEGKGEVSYKGYLSKEAADAKKDPLIFGSFSAQLSDNPELAIACLQYLQGKAMEQEQFNGATQE